MKRYPKVNGQNLDPISKKRFNKIEEIILDYLNMDNIECQNKSNYKVLAYNLAFLLLEQ